MGKLFRKVRPAKHKRAKKEYHTGGFLPYRYFWNKNTLVLKDDSLLQVIRLGGFSFETADDEDVDVRKNIRNLLFKGIGTGDVEMYFHVVRRKKNVFGASQEVDMPPGFASYLEEEWIEKHRHHKSFANDIYLTILRRRKRKGALTGVEGLVSAIKEKTDKSKKLWAKNTREMQADLDEITSRCLSTFRDYRPELLGIQKTENGTYSEILEFLGCLANGAQHGQMTVPYSQVHKYIPTHRLYFGERSIEIRCPAGKIKYAGIVSIKEYSQYTSASVMDSFLQLPFELIISQSYTFIDRNVAISRMKIQQGRMEASDDLAQSQIGEIDSALDMAMSGKIGFGKHHLTVLCVEEDPKDLERALAMVSTELGNAGLVAVREKVNMEPCYWAQMPGNIHMAIRAATLNSLNIASFASFHNYPTGKQEDNHWGPCVTVLDTTSGTPFYFNFHVRDVGHTTIIGPTGAGKTVLMNFLCAQARKFRCRLFFFDKDRGAEIFIRALGGQYSIIDPSTYCRFNPFMMEDTGENRSFLKDWIKLLVTVNGEKITAEDAAKIDTLVTGNFKLDMKDRKLSNLAAFLGIGTAGSISSRIAMWHGSGSHAPIFDNDEDVIDFHGNLIYGFEMAELLKDNAALGPVLSYIFHRISISLDGTPSMIVLDEAWALIDNEIFAPKIKDWLKVLRKLNCFVVFATQSVEDASKSAISDTLIQQTATQIFLPNLKATEVYRSHFMLSEREFLLIKTTDPTSRYFIVKQGVDAVVARVDLSGMDRVIKVLSGGADTVRVLDKIRAKYGDDPKVWLPHFWAVTCDGETYEDISMDD